LLPTHKDHLHAKHQQGRLTALLEPWDSSWLLTCGSLWCQRGACKPVRCANCFQSQGLQHRLAQLTGNNPSDSQEIWWLSGLNLTSYLLRKPLVKWTDWGLLDLPGGEGWSHSAQGLYPKERQGAWLGLYPKTRSMPR
jgi:hypothetical protein